MQGIVSGHSGITTWIGGIDLTGAKVMQDCSLLSLVSRCFLQLFRGGKEISSQVFENVIAPVTKLLNFQVVFPIVEPYSGTSNAKAVGGYLQTMPV